MATTTATITLASADLLSDNLSLSSTTTLYDANTTTGLTQYEMGRVLIPSSDTNSILIKATAAGAGDSSKVYIANKNTDVTQFVVISINSVELGRLYSGDWMFIPWSQSATTHDIEIFCPTTASATHPNGAGNPTADIEYMVFNQGKTFVAAA
jgi:hypothetical protein